MSHPSNKCPTPYKLSYSTSSAAEYALTCPSWTQRDHQPVRAYWCRCGNYHLTSRI